jgi:hypothetical protein
LTSAFMVWVTPPPSVAFAVTLSRVVREIPSAALV